MRAMISRGGWSAFLSPYLITTLGPKVLNGVLRRARLSNSLRPSPGSDAPATVDFAKRHRKERSGLRDLFAVQFECHRRGNDDIRAISGDVIVFGLAQLHGIVRGTYVLALYHRVPIPILAGCRPMPNVWCHAVKDGHWDGTGHRHGLRVAFVEALYVMAHRCHRLCRVWQRR